MLQILQESSTMHSAAHISVPCDCLKLLLETCRRVSGEKPCKSTKISKLIPCGESSHDSKWLFLPFVEAATEATAHCNCMVSAELFCSFMHRHCIQAARSEELSPEAWTVDISLDLEGLRRKSKDVVKTLKAIKIETSSNRKWKYQNHSKSIKFYMIVHFEQGLAAWVSVSKSHTDSIVDMGSSEVVAKYLRRSSLDSLDSLDCMLSGLTTHSQRLLAKTLKRLDQTKNW